LRARNFQRLQVLADDGRELVMIWPILAALAASLAAVIGSAAILLLGPRAERAAVWILSFAIGTLTGAATLHLLPEALEILPASDVMLLFLSGIVLFIVFERVIRWRHVHDSPVAVTARLLLWGDALHNFIDGIVIAIAFSANRELGLITAIAVFAHEVPQEIGDFAVLLATGMSRRRALALNYVSAFAVVVGAVAGVLWALALRDAVHVLLPIAAGGFIYIALADLVPSLHHHRGRWAAAIQIALVVLGAAAIWLLREAIDHA
jgi:zinc and cadmium transporter